MKTMKTLNINVNENNQLIINEMVINLYAEYKNFNFYKLKIEGYSKCVKFWNKLLQQATSTNFGGNLNEQFSFITINNDKGYVITFSCPKNEYKNYWAINIELEK